MKYICNLLSTDTKNVYIFAEMLNVSAKILALGAV